MDRTTVSRVPGISWVGGGATSWKASPRGGWTGLDTQRATMLGCSTRGGLPPVDGAAWATLRQGDWSVIVQVPSGGGGREAAKLDGLLDAGSSEWAGGGDRAPAAPLGQTTQDMVEVSHNSESALVSACTRREANVPGRSYVKHSERASAVRVPDRPQPPEQVLPFSTA